MSTSLSPEQAIAELERDGHAGWRLAEGRPAIAKRFRFRDFDAAFAFMTAVAAHARAADHHPEWSNAYSKVEVVLTTHDAGGVTDKDLALARAMEAAAASV
jgi:4a-hydroxytetrahydrobiopterin dehydratase